MEEPKRKFKFADEILLDRTVILYRIAVANGWMTEKEAIDNLTALAGGMMYIDSDSE